MFGDVDKAFRDTIDSVISDSTGFAVLALLALVLLLALWLIPAFGASWLAEQRGRSAPKWLVLALLIGPIAVVLVGFAPINEPGATLECPACRGRVFLGATRCRWCTTAWEWPAGWSPAEPAP